MNNYKFHPISNIFPMLEGKALVELTEDIRRNGLNVPIVLYEGKILDGRNRLRACQAAKVKPTLEVYTGNDPVALVVSLNLKRRHLTQSQKAAAAVALLPHLERQAKERQGTRTDIQANLPESEKRQSRDEAGKLLGVSGRYVSEAKALEEEAPPLFAEVAAGKTTLSRASRQMREVQARAEMERHVLAADNKAKESLAAVFNVECCDLAELLSAHSDVDAVITDPPYGKEYVPLYERLAAASLNVPLVAVMTGQSYLPEILEAMSRVLPYRWALAYLTQNHQSGQNFNRKINIFWKPVLLFGKATHWLGDVATSNRNEKQFHKWGQSVAGMVDLVERLTKPGQLICDPFCGAGTTGLAALMTKRRFIGGDIDKRSVGVSRARALRWYQEND